MNKHSANLTFDQIRFMKSEIKRIYSFSPANLCQHYLDLSHVFAEQYFQLNGQTPSLDGIIQILASRFKDFYKFSSHYHQADTALSLQRLVLIQFNLLKEREESPNR